MWNQHLIVDRNHLLLIMHWKVYCPLYFLFGDIRGLHLVGGWLGWQSMRSQNHDSLFSSGAVSATRLRACAHAHTHAHTHHIILRRGCVSFHLWGNAKGPVVCMTWGDRHPMGTLPLGSDSMKQKTLDMSHYVCLVSMMLKAGAE